MGTARAKPRAAQATYVTRGGSYCVTRVAILACAPFTDTWSNLGFLAAEKLRGKFDERNVVRLDMVPDPETEAEYDLEAVIVTKGKARIFAPRVVLKKQTKMKRKQTQTAPLALELVTSCSTPADWVYSGTGVKLGEKDLNLLRRFCRLPIRTRIAIWLKHVAKHFVSDPRSRHNGFV